MQRHRYPRPRSCGRSFIEMVAVLGVLSVLAGATVPTLERLVTTYRQQAAVSALHAHLSLARQVAVSRGLRVTMRAARFGWQEGWQVFVDPNANGEVDPGEEVVAVGDRRSLMTISANGAMARYVSFDPSGRPTQLNGAFLSGRFIVCTPHRPPVYELVMNAAGRLRQERLDRPCATA
ncbi:MAG TPA: GspH/FimT family protein [Burkholderiaceae bacterium]|nr:GspH/FimT family protein [Burkholderiaceae bacterium]